MMTRAFIRTACRRGGSWHAHALNFFLIDRPEGACVCMSMSCRNRTSASVRCKVTTRSYHNRISVTTGRSDLVQTELGEARRVRCPARALVYGPRGV